MWKAIFGIRKKSKGESAKEPSFKEHEFSVPDGFEYLQWGRIDSWRQSGGADADGSNLLALLAKETELRETSQCEISMREESGTIIGISSNNFHC